MPKYDVTVVGAGPAGSATAALLAERGFTVALLDRAHFPRGKPCAEYVSPEACRILHALLPSGALDGAAPARLEGMRIVSSDGTSFEGRFLGAHRFRGYAEHGIALRRTILDTMLVEAAVARGAILMEDSTVESIDLSHLTTHRGVVFRRGASRTRIVTRLVVGADGIHSRVARSLGLARRGRLSRVALVAHATGVAGMRQMGEIHVTRSGYVGLAPVGHGLTNVAVVRDSRHTSGRPAKWFHATIAAIPELASRLERAVFAPPLQGAGPFARGSTRATSARAVLVGDAADFYDPFTGEGIFAALHGAELIERHVAALLEHDQLDQRDLRPYDRARRKAFGGKWIVERVVGWAVAHPFALNHAARRLKAKPHLADLLVGVTGDFVPAGQVLRPSFASQLVW